MKSKLITQIIEILLLLIFLIILALFHEFLGSDNYYETGAARFFLLFVCVAAIYPVVMGFIVRLPSLLARRRSGYLMINWPRLIGAVIVGLAFVLVPQLLTHRIITISFFRIFVEHPRLSTLAAFWVGTAIADSFESSA